MEPLGKAGVRQGGDQSVRVGGGTRAAYHLKKTENNLIRRIILILGFNQSLYNQGVLLVGIHGPLTTSKNTEIPVKDNY